MNPFTKIGKEWLLITAGNEEKMQYHDSKLGCNGCYVGKERSDSVYPSSEIHQGICGQGRYIYNFCSGRRVSQGIKLLRKGFRKKIADNKIKEAGLTPYFTDGTAGIEEADMIMICKKMYHDEIKPECFDAGENDSKWYPQKDYHTMYIAEILKVLVRE